MTDNRYKDADGTMANPECDGKTLGRSCTAGEVQTFSTGGDGNAILCESCAKHHGYKWRTRPTQPLTQHEFSEEDTEAAERLAKVLGYEQTAYTSCSALWGLFCLPENPEYHPDKPHRGGCIIKTAELGLMFVQNVEDITGEMTI